MNGHFGRIATPLALAALALWLVIPGLDAAGTLLFEASMRNADYGGGLVINTFGPDHGGSPGVPGVVTADDGTRFTATEVSGRSNGLVNWQLPAASRAPFRTAGTVSFCASADRLLFATGEIFGDNSGFSSFRNGQGAFGTGAALVPNGPGAADDQWSVGTHTWHNNVWVNHAPTPPLEMDRVYRIGLTWGATPTQFEIWVDGQLISVDNNLQAVGQTLPWGGFANATNFGFGDNHERGYPAYNSVAGVTVSDVRIWAGYQQYGDSDEGCGAANAAPIADDAAATTDEDTATSIVLGATDADGDALSFAVDSGPSHGVLTGTAPSLQYAPNANFNGSDSFTFSVGDGNGGTDTAIVSITVLPVNDVPVAGDDAVSTLYGMPVAVHVLANDSDADGDGLSVEAVTQGGRGSVAANGDGTVTYTPPLTPVDSLKTLVDGLGLNKGQANSLRVKLDAASRSMARGNMNAASGQIGAFINEVEALERSGRISASAAAALLAEAATALAGGPSTDSFTYTVSDGHGGAATARVTIIIVP